MPGINSNYNIQTDIQSSSLQQESSTNFKANHYTQVPQRNLRDEFTYQHKKNGLFERFYNWLKNLTGIGVGSKKAQQAIDRAEKGQINEQEARNVIDKYRKSQANSEQAIGDVLSVGASGFTFFGLMEFLKKKGAEAVLNEKYYSNQSGKGFNKKLNEFFLKFGKNKSKATIFAALTAAYVGGITKSSSLSFNRIGSKEFKCDKKDFNGAKTKVDKALYKEEKKETTKKRIVANLRNFFSGAINGLMMPITMLGGAFVGVPAYFVGNSLNRYFVGNHEEKNKSVNGYIKNLSSDGVAHAAVVAAAVVPMVKKAQFTKVLDENLTKTVNKLKDATLKESGLQGKTTYQELDEILRGSNAVRNIANNESMSINDRILALTKENLFAVKMRQISNDGSKLTNALRENCPPSRTLENAQTAINKALGDNYTVKQLLGVGTVAETYLAKDKTGKEVCIKILKEGITKEKVLADKAKFIETVKATGKPQSETDNLLRNIDDMSDGLLKELDLSLEMEAAKKLEGFTKIANVVKPIEVKNGAYVMEKANGISLASLVELNSAKAYKEALESNNPILSEMTNLKGKLGTLLKDVKTKEEKLKIVNDYIKQVEARTPQFGDINLTKEDFKALIEEYQHVLVEQFNKIGKDGKILHADIHPGNIFIDVNALRARKKGALTEIQSHLGRRENNKIFTLIDTGNVVTMNQEQAMRAINLTSYIKKGNVNDIAEYMLYGVEGPALGGHTKEKAKELLVADLKKVFFDNETQLKTVTNESLVEMASNIMRKHGIVPADTQMTLNKAKQSAGNSLHELAESLVYFYLKDLAKSKNMALGFSEFMAKITKDVMLLENKNRQLIKVQENLNLRHLPLEQQLLHKNNPNMLKTNSEDYLTYHLKQQMKQEKNIPNLDGAV